MTFTGMNGVDYMEVVQTTKKCIVIGCGKLHSAKGYCRNHYQKYRKYGSPLFEKREVKPILFEVDDKGCYICTSHARNRGGYPVMTRSNKQVKISRFIYEECYGNIPRGAIVRHKCDEPNCINPEHLKIGTNQDNSRDMVERNRQAYGERNGLAKLTEKDVKEIRLLNKHFTYRELAKIYNVSYTNIASIVNNETWVHV